MATANPVALLERLLKEDNENQWLEFKHDICDPERIGECIAACANAAILKERDHAYVIFGIEDKTKRKLGTSVRLNQMKKGGENLTNWLSRMIDPKLNLEFLDFEDGGNPFAIITIESTYDRPVRFSGTEYIRIGSNTKKLREFPEHERTLWLATSRRKFESAIALSHQSIEDIFSKLDVNVYYRLSRQAQPENSDQKIRKLLTEEFIRDDMEGAYDITNLGAIILAKDITLFPSIRSKSVRAIKYTGKDKRKTDKEMEGRKGYAVGFSGLIKYVLDQLPGTEKYVNGIRLPGSLYPETAIREIISNALIHQDFTLSGAGPVIEIYEDRIEIINPGNSLIPIDRIIDERRTRNEKLAATMRILGLCEERGGGIDKAIIQIEEMSLPAPEFYPSENSMRVVLFGPRKFANMSKDEKIWACFCHCVVRWLRHDYMNNTSLRERFSLPTERYQTVSEIISAAKKMGRIVPAETGQERRTAKYVPYWTR